MKVQFFITLATTIFLIIVLILYFNTNRTEAVQPEPVRVQELTTEEYEVISHRETWTHEGVIREINLARSERHLPPLLRLRALDTVAYEYNSVQMANGEISHHLWDKDVHFNRLYEYCKGTGEGFRKVPGGRLSIWQLLASRYPTEVPTDYYFAHTYDRSPPHSEGVYHNDATFIGLSIREYDTGYFIVTYIIMEK